MALLLGGPSRPHAPLSRCPHRRATRSPTRSCVRLPLLFSPLDLFFCCHFFCLIVIFDFAFIDKYLLFVTAITCLIAPRRPINPRPRLLFPSRRPPRWFHHALPPSLISSPSTNVPPRHRRRSPHSPPRRRLLPDMAATAAMTGRMVSTALTLTHTTCPDNQLNPNRYLPRPRLQ
jgi:hypothetical protein